MVIDYVNDMIFQLSLGLSSLKIKVTNVETQEI